MPPTSAKRLPKEMGSKPAIGKNPAPAPSKRSAPKPLSDKKTPPSAANIITRPTLYGVVLQPGPTPTAEIRRNIKKSVRSTWSTDKAPWSADLTERIPRAEVEAHAAFLMAEVPTTTVAGSYRRGAASSSDIDIIVREPIADVLARLTARNYIKHTFAAGNRKFSGVVQLSPTHKFRHLDIVFTTPRAYPFALLYFTGPARFNIVLRLIAKRRGLKLNEYGLWRGTTLIPGLATERAIFAALDRPYREPHERV